MTLLCDSMILIVTNILLILSFFFNVDLFHNNYYIICV